MKRHVLFVLLVLLAFTGIAKADMALPYETSYVIYVNGSTGSDSNSGRSWEEAKRTIQGAIAIAGDYAEIWVAAGTYSGTGNPAFQVRPMVQLYGGFSGTETSRGQRNWRDNETILEGTGLSGGQTLVQLEYFSVVDGFTIRKGNIGIMALGTGYSYTIISHNVIQEVNTGVLAEGWTDSEVDISNNVITDYTGTGVFCLCGDMSVINNTIARVIQNSASAGNTIGLDIISDESCGPGYVYVSNNIICWNNIGIQNSGQRYALVNNCVYGNTTEYSYVLPGSADINPEDNVTMFAATGDFHLHASSPCIDAGENYFPQLRDIDGQTRHQGTSGKCDIGADEYDHTYETGVGTASAAPCSNTIPITVNYSGATGGSNGLKRVELWYKKSYVGTWTYSGLYSTQEAGSFQFTPAIQYPEDVYYFDLVVEDNSGHRTATPTGSGDCKCTYDVTSPTGTIIINNGAATTPLPTVNIDLSAADNNGIAGMELSDTGSFTGDWQDFDINVSWSLPGGSGAKTIYARFKDCAGNTFTASDSIELQNGTTDFSSELPMDATGFVFDNTSGLWVHLPYCESPPCQSPSVTVEAGQPVRLKLASSSGGMVTDIDHYNYSTSPVGIADTISCTFTFTPRSTGDPIIVNHVYEPMLRPYQSGCSYFWPTDEFSQVLNVPGTYDLTWYCEDLADYNGAHRPEADDVDACVALGNCTFYSGRGVVVVQDTAGPTGSVIINELQGYPKGNPFTDTTAVTLTLSAEDPSGVTAVRISNDGVFDGSPAEENWQNFEATKSWNLPSGAELKTVHVQFKDSLDRVSSTYTDTIGLNVAGPVDFSPEDGAEGSCIDVKLFGGPEGCTIRYTVDGTDPVETNPDARVYDPAGSVVVNLDATHTLITVKAQATKSGLPDGQISQAQYTYDSTAGSSVVYTCIKEVTVSGSNITNLRLTDISYPGMVRLFWDGPYNSFEVKRQPTTNNIPWESVSALSESGNPNSLPPFTDTTVALGFWGYRYAVKGVGGNISEPPGQPGLPLCSVAHANCIPANHMPFIRYIKNDWAEISVTPVQVIAGKNATVDSRLDTRYIEPKFVDYKFSKSLYRGGLFAGHLIEPDHSGIGRSFLGFSLPRISESDGRMWAGSLNAFYTRSAANDTSTNVGCNFISYDDWKDKDVETGECITWTQATDLVAPGLTPASAPEYVKVGADADAIHSENWCHWTAPSLWTILEMFGDQKLSIALASTTESSPGDNNWAYFARKEFDSELAPRLVYAYGKCGYGDSYGTGAVYVVGMQLSASSVKGGNTVIGTVFINGPAPAGGATVTLKTDSCKARVPSTVQIPAGSLSATFTVSTAVVDENIDIVITAEPEIVSGSGATLRITL